MDQWRGTTDKIDPLHDQRDYSPLHIHTTQWLALGRMVRESIPLARWYPIRGFRDLTRCKHRKVERDGGDTEDGIKLIQWILNSIDGAAYGSLQLLTIRT